MNLLSIISIIIYTSFFIGAWRILTAERKTVLNVSACATLLSLGFWSFCNSFFFSAPNVEQAFMWHRISSIGWCSFVALTAYYFISLTKEKNKKVAWWKNVLFFTPTVILIIKNLFGKTTSLAQSIIPSESGFGYTYQNSITSFWLWAYLIYVAFYFGIIFYLLTKWAKSVKHRMKKDMAIGFIILDLTTVLFGVITDVILPLTNPVLPALASIGTALFGIGYFGIIYKHDVFNINLVISSEDILKTSNNPIFVADENGEILKCNKSASELLGYNKTELIGELFSDIMLNPIDFRSMQSPGELLNIDSKMRCKDGTIRDVLVSSSSATDKHNNFLCSIVTCQDVTKQKNIQQELFFEQEKYKELANDYQRLANFDALTSLPNRRYFFEALNEFEELYNREKKDFAVLFMDLDNFKHINDIYGHKAGDDLLIEAANKLKIATINDDFLARLGGDEFIIITPYVSPSSIERKLCRINEEFAKKVPLNGQLYQINLSIGSGVFSQIGDITKLMQIADEAMYGHKQQKKQL
ncbi:MAG: diguanylate cyclase [Clostridia bacterium]